ncbi:PIR protein [Plasmodium yoelii yoelii]|nr:PIR protein [Plasmodium yoelii yoelii]
MCGEFSTIWKFFPDELKESKDYNFNSSMLKKHCPDRNCNNDIDKINAGCLWLFKQFYGSLYNFSSNANENMNIVTYIMTWVSYKLNQKKQDGITKFNEFYSRHIKNVDEYNNSIEDSTEYRSYIDLMNKKQELMDIDIKLMSKLYDLFKNLCKMYNDFSKTSNNRKDYIEYANKFADEYKKLFNDNDNNVEGSSYYQILTTLSNDYNYFRNSYVSSNIGNTLPKLITEKTPQNSVLNSIETQDVSLSGIPESKSETDVSSSKDKVSDSDSGSPSSSILNKLISIPFIFVATLILLGIAYKYSLFGFRKRSQKQHLREKLKK